MGKDESVSDKGITKMVSEQPEGPPPLESLDELEKTDWEEFRKTFEEIEIMSKRGWAIVAASHLDEQLVTLLKAFFVDDQRTADQVLEDPGAISAFGARIELAFLLGLISARERKMLNLIRKIRNSFAHSSRVASFSQSPIKERCLELDAKPILESKTLSDQSPEGKFIAAFSFLLLVLVHRRGRLKRREEAEAITEDYVAAMAKEISEKSK
jgi:DNA-binding MltR family transcriptional regulator